MITTQFYNRDGTERPAVRWSSLDVSSLVHSAKGGPKSARAQAIGSKSAMWEFLEMIGSPVVMRDSKHAEDVWWGQLYKVVISDGESRVEASLGGMANSVAVAHTFNLKRFTTTYTTDADSIAEYGTKQLMLTARELTNDQAEIYRDTELEKRKYPQRPEPVKAASDVPGADLYFRGWWDTLTWTYFLNEAGLVSYWEIDNWYGREIGEDGRPSCAQSFVQNSGAAWDAYHVYVRIRKVGAPATDLRLDLMSDAAGKPNASLANCTLVAATFTDRYDEYKFTLSVPVSLVSGTTYWVMLATTGAIDVDNYYIVDGNATSGYADGEFMLYNTVLVDWVYWPHPMDANFRVEGQSETTGQIEVMVTDEGQFLAGTDIVDDSGVYTNQARNGRTNAQYEIVKLLDMGTSTNRRLLARVLSNRLLQVYAEPNQGEYDYSKSADGIVTNYLGQVVAPSSCPVGVWMNYEDIVPSTVNTSKLSSMDRLFVEEAAYLPQSDTYEVRMARGEDVLQSLFGVVNG